MPSRSLILWLLGALLLAFPLVRLPDAGPWLAAKAFALEAGGIVLAVYVASRGEWTAARARAALRAPPNPAVLLFVLWAALSLARPGLPANGPSEVMRHLGGALLYFAVAYGLSPRRHLGPVAALLALAGVVGVLGAYSETGGPDSGLVSGAFQNSQILAGFLCLLMPVLLGAAMAPARGAEVWYRLGCQAGLVLVVLGLLVGQNRSAWLGAGTALGLLLFLVARFRDEARPLYLRAWIVPALVLAAGAGFLISRLPARDLVARRAGSLGALDRDVSARWRLAMASKALRMIRDRPLTGWGAGTFALQQALYFHPEAPSRDQADIRATGATLAESPHNSYLELGAELGLPGLALYLALFAGYFRAGLRALPGMRPGFPRSLLVGCLAAIGGQMVCALGSPAWEFPECSLFLWLVLGMGMAAAGIGETHLPAESPPRRRKERAARVSNVMVEWDE